MTAYKCSTNIADSHSFVLSTTLSPGPSLDGGDKQLSVPTERGRFGILWWDKTSMSSGRLTLDLSTIRLKHSRSDQVRAILPFVQSGFRHYC